MRHHANGAFLKRGLFTAMLVAVALSVASCGSRTTREDKIAYGAIAGAVTGALVGFEFIGSGSGRWLGALALGAVGASAGKVVAERLTRWDRSVMQETAYGSLTTGPIGSTAAWRNPDTGTNGTITPLRTFLDERGRLCRDYNTTLELDGEFFDGDETACLLPGGDWVIG